MIPIHLYLAGFLSYHDPVEIDFTPFDLACIAGANGAGKSSLLDAITWALFGQARKRDDSLINAQSKQAEVRLTFAYEGNIYRVLRAKAREKTAILEFQVMQTSPEDLHGVPPDLEKAHWNPLTERALRETEARIEHTLRMDYDTFVNASFFLQGKADQFTQQRPGDRKRILGSILGLEIWDTYRQRAADKRKAVENEVVGLDGRLREIVAELAEEEPRKARLEQLKTEMLRLSRERSEQEAAVMAIRRISATLAEQAKMVEALKRQLDNSVQQVAVQQQRLDDRCRERDELTQAIAHAAQVEAAYQAWQSSRQELERWEGVAARFREQEKLRNGPREEIHAAQVRLEQEMHALLAQRTQVEALEPEMLRLREQVETYGAKVQEAEQALQGVQKLEASLKDARQRQADARAENPRLKKEMEELKARIDQLVAVETASCPVCGQPLDADRRLALIDELKIQGKEMGDRYRANLSTMRWMETEVGDLEGQMAALVNVEAGLRRSLPALAQAKERLDTLVAARETWQTEGAIRLQQAQLALANDDYALQARQQLALVDAELKAIGYDAAAHDAIRRAELDGRASEAEMRTLERARAALEPLQREIADLQTQIDGQQAGLERQRTEYDQAAAALAESQAQAPNLVEAEQIFFHLQEQENRLRLEIGAAQQKVDVLDDLKARRKNLEGRRAELARLAGQYKQLEQAFSKDGVPALLIEQALPEIENRANDVLAKLSGGTMAVQFVTQAAFKDKRRDDLRETLDIRIRDGDGERDYEMFSGGEAFRVNFAIRLALSEVLAQRSGARLQTLVVDEGFGSQDALGRQRLIEAINMVRADFAKILVITHIEELKDEFPNRIEVDKTERGSSVRVL